jgi:putative ABC transport system substrate-binding protein
MLLLGGAITAARALRAQQKGMSVIGLLGVASPDPFAPFVAAFHQGLGETGYIEGQNVAIEYRWAEGHPDRLPALAADLVGRSVEVIAAFGGPQPASAAMGATTAIPIVAGAAGNFVKHFKAGGQSDRREPLNEQSDAEAARTARRAGSRRGNHCSREPRIFRV